MGLTFSANLTLVADYEIKYDAFKKCNSHIEMKLRGSYGLALRADVSFKGELTLDIKNLLDWNVPIQAVMGPVPIILDLSLGLDVSTKTTEVDFAAGFQFEISQDFIIGFWYDREKNTDCKSTERYETMACHSTCKKGCWTDTCAGEADRQKCSRPGKTRYACLKCSDCTETKDIIRKIKKPKKSASYYLSGNSKDDDGKHCAGSLQDFGFDITPSLDVGVLFYNIVHVYIRPEMQLPVRMNVPESDGEKCGWTPTPASSSFDMCSNQLQASWSIELIVRAFVGFDFSSLELMFKHFMWLVKELKNGKSVNKWLEEAHETRFGGRDMSLGEIAHGCINLPDVLASFYSHLCCGSKGASSVFFSHLLA